MIEKKNGVSGKTTRVEAVFANVVSLRTNFVRFSQVWNKLRNIASDISAVGH